jgi:hypothetical protein
VIWTGWSSALPVVTAEIGDLLTILGPVVDVSVFELVLDVDFFVIDGLGIGIFGTSDVELFDAFKVSGVAVASVVDEGFSWGGLAKDVVKGFVDAVAASEVVLAAIKDIAAFAVILLGIVGSEEVTWGSDGGSHFAFGWDGDLFVAKELNGGFWKSTFGVWDLSEELSGIHAFSVSEVLDFDFSDDLVFFSIIAEGGHLLFEVDIAKTIAEWVSNLMAVGPVGVAVFVDTGIAVGVASL